MNKRGVHIRVGNFSAHKDRTHPADGQDIEEYSTSILHMQNFCPQTWPQPPSASRCEMKGGCMMVMSLSGGCRYFANILRYTKMILIFYLLFCRSVCRQSEVVINEDRLSVRRLSIVDFRSFLATLLWPRISHSHLLFCFFRARARS